MNKCEVCGKEIIGRRGDSKTCSTECSNKKKYIKSKEKSKDTLLADDLVRNLPKIPVLQKTTQQDKEIAKTVNNVINDTLGGLPFQSVLTGTAINIMKPDTDPLYTLGIIGGVLIGGLGGWYWNQLNGKPPKKIKENRLRNTFVGSTTVAGLVHLGFTVYNQHLTKKYKKETEILRLQQEQQDIEYQMKLAEQKYENTLDGLKNITTVSGSKMMNEMPPSFAYNGKFKDFLGHQFDIGFQCVLYGDSFSGKSHLLAQFVGEFSNIGRCLVVLSEQGTGFSARKMYQRYPNNQNNVEFVSNIDVSKIDYLLENNNYDFLFIDSIDLVKGLRTAIDRKDYLEGLKEKILGSFVVTHATKSGDIKGSYDVVYNADIALKVDGGIATWKKVNADEDRQKNRYLPPIHTIAVFDDIKIDNDGKNEVQEKDTSNRLLDEAKRLINFDRRIA